MNPMFWTLLSVQPPQPGQLCLISFSSAPERIRLCYFDSVKTFEKREYELDFEMADGHEDGWFTDANNPEDWWEPKYVSFWMPVWSPPSANAKAGEM